MFIKLNLTLNQSSIKKILLFCILFHCLIFSKEVSKFAYKGQPEDFNDSTITVPKDMVALSEYQYVGTPTDTLVDPINSPAFMFVIDNSGSMSQLLTGVDRKGNRFNVPKAVIDSLYKKSPNTQVGITVFNENLYFDPKDDPIFKSCPQHDTGAYIPFLQLNKDYNGKKGYKILKDYLKVETEILFMGLDTLTKLIYKPSWSIEGLTHINAGFDAVRDAAQNTNIKKENQYVIFFSDGEATHPEEPPGLKDEYIKGIKMPTTFTMYFVDASGQAPQSLLQMNNNIKNNRYSLSNRKSNIWEFENTTSDTLINFIMNNILNQILKKTKLIPFNMSINGGQGVSNWDSTGFTYPSLFPLLGEETQFEYKINYHVVSDTDTVYTKEFMADSLVTVNYTVKIDPNQSALSNTVFDVRKWDRDIGFYFQNTLVSEIKNSMDSLEIRFTYNGGSANYQYTQAKIEITSTTGQIQDKETFVLNNMGSYFTKKFPLVVIGNNISPTQGDGKIQYYETDTLIAVFRNTEQPTLPLDTLLISSPCIFSGKVNINHAEYYDNTADGYIDSIFINASTDIPRGFTETLVKEVVENALTLPDFRKFEIKGYGIHSDGFYTIVKEDKSHNPVTYVRDDDKITVKTYNFSSGGRINTQSVKIYDKVAPIIHWEKRSALLIDHINDSIADTLTVKFSEPIKRVISDEPFHFLDNKGGKKYSIKLKEVYFNYDKMVFIVQSLSGIEKMAEGDSIWIYEGNRVGDALGNFQNNTKNIKRILYVDKIFVPYTLIPQAVSPVDISDLGFKHIIPNTIISALQNDGILHECNLSQINSNYVGMVIMVLVNPENLCNYLPNLKLKASLSIFDPLGNFIVKDLKMAWNEDRCRLVTVWNCKNKNLRTVGRGTYVGVFNIEDITVSVGYKDRGIKNVERLLLGVKK